MNILLSAYACEPDKGSEPGVGWNWAIELAQLGHQVQVLTRSNNRQSIEKLLTLEPRHNLKFVYYDLPKWLGWWKKGRRGVHLYYFLWQIGIYFLARSMMKVNTFDIIHHVTFVSLRQPSFLGYLGIPFIFGPVAGGERTPFQLRRSFPLRGLFIDGLRDIINLWVKASPLMFLTLRSADKIYVTSKHSYDMLPKRFRYKTSIRLAIGGEAGGASARPISNEGPIRILYAGNLLYWKGVHLALRAFAIHLQSSPDSKFTIVGRGPELEWLQSISFDLQIDKSISWCGWVSREQLEAIYQRHDVFLFPSLRDSGGMVVTEALRQGLPVICLDIGGPGVIVDNGCGYRISTDKKSEVEVIHEIALALTEYRASSKTRENLMCNAVRRAKEMHWRELVTKVYSE